MLIVEHLGNTKKKKIKFALTHKPYQQASNLEISTVKIWVDFLLVIFLCIYNTLKKILTRMYCVVCFYCGSVRFA